MKQYRSRSVFQLTFIGFTVVTLPLIAALVMAFLTVDKMVRQSQSVLYDATSAVKLSHELVEELTELERFARQYLVLGDADVWALYLEEHEEFTEMAADLQQLPLRQKQRKPLSKMISIEQSLYSWLQAGFNQKEDSTLATRYFRNLSSLGELLLDGGSESIQRTANSIQHRAESTKNLLFWQSIVLIPAALFLAFIFTILITKPLRQVGRSIHEIGRGQLETPVTITGPRDIRKLGKRLEWLRNRLTDLEAQKTSVLRHISHDLKTPLTALREGTELLSDQTLGALNEQQREIVSILKTNCLKLQKQVEDLLNFGATQQHLEANNREIVTVPALLHEVITTHELAAKPKDLEFKTHLVDCEVFGDPTQLRVIFDNLVSNAIKYSPNSGQISIVLKTSGSSVVLDVLDQGPGIDAMDKDRLFEPYFQGRVTSDGPVKGTGLGLAIAQEFARLHKGIIEAVDNSVGAHFRLTLPLEN